MLLLRPAIATDGVLEAEGGNNGINPVVLAIGTFAGFAGFRAGEFGWDDRLVEACEPVSAEAPGRCGRLSVSGVGQVELAGDVWA